MGIVEHLHSGTCSDINIEGINYSGRMLRTSSEEYMPFTIAFARNNKGGAASAFGTGSTARSNVLLMAILYSGNGESMRCALQGDRMSVTAGGICVDNKNNAYDVIYYK